MAAPSQSAPNDELDLSAGIVAQPQQPAAPQQGSDDIDLSAGIVAPSPHDDPSVLRQFWAARPHPIEEAKGFAKGMGNTVAGLLDLYSKAGGAVAPGVIPGTAGGASRAADAIRQRTAIHPPTAASTPEQKAAIAAQEQGEIAETLAEFFALPEVEGEAIAAKIPTLSEHLAQGAELAKFLEKNRKIAGLLRIGVKAAKGAARGGVEQAGQTYIKTGGDAEAAADAGETGAMLGGVVGAGAGALREAGGAIGRAKPKGRTIAGANFETTGKEGDLLLRPLKENPIDPATAAVDEASGNIGKTAVANSLNRANAARPQEIPVAPPTRQLPAPEGAKPAFSIDTGEPVETPEGELLQPARKKQIGTRVVEGKGPGKFNLEQYETGQAPAPTGEGELTQRGSHREPINQYLTDVKPGSPPARSDTVSGPGTLIFTNDGQGLSSTKARLKFIQNERILNNEDALNEMTVKQHNDLLAEQADLSDQLRRYDQYAASQPHFPEHDVMEAVRNTDGIGDAGELLKASHSPFWQVADDASGKQWTDIREEEKYLQKQLHSQNPIADYDGLMTKLEANKQKQLAFFDKYRTKVSPEEWTNARDGYQDGIVLSNLDHFIQGKFNGITRADQAARPGLQRVFKPSADFNNQLEKFLNTGTNREVLERTMGKEHILDLKEIGQLFEGAQRQEATKTLIEHISAAIRRHRWAARGVAGGLGYGVGHALGGVAGGAVGTGAGILTGPLVSGTVSGTYEYIASRLASDKEFLRSFTYAVKNNVSPRFAAPLLMQRILSTSANFPEQKRPRTETETVVPADESRGVKKVELPVLKEK